jgi:hypothetical protein
MNYRSIGLRIKRLEQLGTGLTAELGNLGMGQGLLAAAERKGYGDAIRDAIEALYRARRVLEVAQERVTGSGRRP